jgi:uncharacterized protein YukE
VGVQLPSEVAWFLNIIGVAWPNIDEDQVRQFASHVRTFASNLSATHQAATSTLNQMGPSYTGASYTALLSAWQSRSAEHMTQLNNGCQVVGTALEAAADAIVVAKGAAIAELIALASAFAAEQAAAIETLGASEALAALTVLAARKCVNVLIEQLTFYVVAEVIEKAVAPLEGVVAKAVNGLVFEGLDAALGHPMAGSVGDSVHIDTEALTAYADTMRGHAEEMAEHAQTFSGALAGVRFG